MLKRINIGCPYGEMETKGHAHIDKGEICIRDFKYLYKRDGSEKLSGLLIHELAHILTGRGHDPVFREKVAELRNEIWVGG